MYCTSGRSRHGICALKGPMCRVWALASVNPGHELCHGPHHQGSQSDGNVQVSLVVPWKARPAVGTEVLINYGRKSNEELLLLYGARLLYQSRGVSPELGQAQPIVTSQGWSSEVASTVSWASLIPSALHSVLQRAQDQF